MNKEKLFRKISQMKPGDICKISSFSITRTFPYYNNPSEWQYIHHAQTAGYYAEKETSIDKKRIISMFIKNVDCRKKPHFHGQSLY